MIKDDFKSPPNGRTAELPLNIQKLNLYLLRTSRKEKETEPLIFNVGLVPKQTEEQTSTIPESCNRKIRKRF